MAMKARKDNTENRTGVSALPLKKGQAISQANFPKFQTLASLNAYLLTQGYTQDKLDVMGKNDMIFAARKKLSLT